jgi:UDP-N-acetylmuramate--alanine ligase
MDPDHLDIYHTPKEMEDAFVQFTLNLKPGGLLLAKKGIQREAELKGYPHQSYHLTDELADIHTSSLATKEGGYVFNAVGPDWEIKSIELRMGGMHNVENSLVAIAVAKHLGINEDLIRNALANFMGVKRRFEYVIQSEGLVYIDDYAHHPEELRVLISGAKAMFPNRKCTLVFQPHLFSRTRDLVDGFAEVLGLVEQVILLPIYPARELPIDGITSAWLANQVKSGVTLLEKDELENYLVQLKPELLITAGAGDIDKLVEPIKQALLNS